MGRRWGMRGMRSLGLSSRVRFGMLRRGWITLGRGICRRRRGGLRVRMRRLPISTLRTLNLGTYIRTSGTIHSVMLIQRAETALAPWPGANRSLRAGTS